MRIKISNATTSSGTLVQVNHGLNDEGNMAVEFHTNDVIFIDVQGAGVYEVDMTRENPAFRFFKRHEHEWGPEQYPWNYPAGVRRCTVVGCWALSHD